MIIVIIVNNNGKKKNLQNICTYITSKRIELEGASWSGFEFVTKPDQPGLSSSIRLEVVKERTQLVRIGQCNWITKVS